MMNEKTINEQYAYIRTLLEEKRLKEALMQLESLPWESSKRAVHGDGSLKTIIQCTIFS